jgi:V/A-type H+-transporting ATPase subunit A
MASDSRSAEEPHPDGRRARVVAVRESLVTVDFGDARLRKNEVGFVRVGEERLMAEVLRIQGRHADLQVFEDTRGVRAGDEVEMSGQLLSVELGPGMLGQVYDGLQNPLDTLAQRHGFFLPRGVRLPALDRERRWHFVPSLRIGDPVSAGRIVGTTREGHFEHRVMAPFDLAGAATVSWIGEGNVGVGDAVARLRDARGQERSVFLSVSWPVRRSIPAALLRRHEAERLYPETPLITTQRVIDTFFPIARGGTACIPGPFGAGKTVLQSLIARYAAIDIVVIIACGERAGEVVETITEYPQMRDPRTGGSLMDRTIIVCNTSSMPVAARESSIYTGITIGEFYRQMGYHVLCIADSTSRWAQAMRETSGRMEEIPGEEAFPAYLDSTIKTVYERAGQIRTPDGEVGSLTLIGTVSPAGGNFEEPVTQATLGTVKTFLGLSADRAYKRLYPAIDPLISWSRYHEQLASWFAGNVDARWTADVRALTALLHAGESISQIMQVTGEEGITREDFLTWCKALFLDTVYLQQDAFDEVDASTPIERQAETLRLVKKIVEAEYGFEDKGAIRGFFTRLTSLFRNMNYARTDSAEHGLLRAQIEALFAESSLARKPAD